MVTTINKNLSNPFSPSEMERETERLFQHLSSLHWSRQDCTLYAPLTLEIERLKKEKDAVILAHSYQTPDIMYGVADFVGDSYGLSVEAQKVSAGTILFSGVIFMAETAKILNPSKRVLIPSDQAGCSLADSITAEDVRTLKKQHPGAPVVCYVNTTAEVKAESDICVTSANAVKIMQALPDPKVIFIPDKFMARNLGKLTDKEVIAWDGTCIVHERFTAAQIQAQRKAHPGIMVLAHSECPEEVIQAADAMGGTGDMLRIVKEASDGQAFMIVTECGLAARMRSEFPTKQFYGTCNMCPFMKQNTLKNIRQTLLSPQPNQIIEVPESIRIPAEKALQRMLDMGL